MIKFYSKGDVKMFESLKAYIMDLIKNNKDNELTPDTKCNKSGIYMIYINNFNDNKILPIYIGEAKNLQKRYKDHYQEILCLNRLTYDEYKWSFIDKNFYDGHFKSCKIFKYMLEHECTLKDYKFIVLEYCNEELLEDKEQYYIQQLKSEYFGFNQLNVTTCGNKYYYSTIDNAKYKFNKDYIIKYYKMVQDNCRFIKKYYQYGYTNFNYNYAFYSKEIKLETKDEDIQKELVLTNKMIVELNKEMNSNYIKRKIDATENRDKFEYGTEEYKSYDKLKKEIYKELRETLLPCKQFNPFDLKDNYSKKNVPNNTVYFYISNNRRNKDAEIIKVDININKNIEEFWINGETSKRVFKGIEYVEKELYFRDYFSISRPVRYKVVPKDSEYDFGGVHSPDYISILSEFKNGINDYTLKQQSFTTLEKVVNTIIKYIDNTKLKFKASESMAVLETMLEYGVNDDLFEKIKYLIK